ncbi:MAG: GGDEF domain-containing protein [Hyphomicrobiales bacterium]|nr:MAG: GGDEF domain-containing protein [Hyphomicrobiales bacterium]
MIVGVLIGTFKMSRFFSKKAVNYFVALEALFVLAAGLLVFYAYWMSSAVVVQQINGVYRPSVAQNYLFYSMFLLLLAFLCIVMIILPMMRRSQDETINISNLAKSFEKQAITDVLTNLPNRRYFESAFKAYLKEFNQQDLSFGLLVMDLDHFKSFNDNYGHETGDRILKIVAQRLKGLTREHDIVARIGGEEFAVITLFATDAQLRAVAERYRANIADIEVQVENAVLRPTISIGIASNALRQKNIKIMFSEADKKLYEAKRKGRNRVAA